MCQICAKHYMLSGLNIATVVLFSGLNISAGVDGGLSGVLCVHRHVSNRGGEQFIFKIFLIVTGE